MEVDVSLQAILVAAALLSGFIDAIAGGGGLVVIPIMLISGIPPLATLGTGKLQAIGSTLAASYSYSRQGYVKLREQLWPAIFCVFAGLLGALSISILPTEWLKIILPFLLIGVALYFGFKRSLSDEDRHARLSAKRYGTRVAPFIAFYDGLFGPGAGTFYMLGFVALSGLGLTRATAHTKLLNLASNFGAFLTFAFIGVVNWRLGLMMGVAQIIGASFEARLGGKKGAKIIRPLLVVTTIALAIKLLLN